MRLGGGHEQVIHSAWRAEVTACCVCSEGKDEQNDDEHDGVDIVGKEGSLDATEDSIQDHANRKEEASCGGVHAGETGDYSRASSEQHSSDQDVRHQAKDDEDLGIVHELRSNCDSVRTYRMCNSSISRPDNFQESMRIWCSSLQLDRKRSKQDDLHSRTRSIPEGSGDTISIGNTGTLQQSGRPSPAGDDSGSHKTTLDSTASSGEHLGGLHLHVVAFEDEGGQDHAESEEEAQTKDYPIAHAFAEGWCGHGVSALGARCTV